MPLSAHKLFELGWDYYDNVWLKWLPIGKNWNRRVRLQEVGVQSFQAHCQDFKTEKLTIAEAKASVSEALTALAQLLQQNEAQDDALFAVALTKYAQELRDETLYFSL